MKFSVFAAFAILISNTTFAAAPSKEMVDLTRALLNSPQLGQQLSSACAERLTSYEVSEVKPGVQKFNLTFSRSGYCAPITAAVTIVEDLRPTYVDGHAIYKTDLVLTPGDKF